MQFHFKCETLRVLSKQLRCYKKKTDKFRLTNHSRPFKQFNFFHCRIARVFIASVFSELEPKYKNIRSCNHRSINLFRHDKAKETRRWESENFDGKLHLKKQIKIQLSKHISTTTLKVKESPWLSENSANTDICIDSDRDNREKHLKNFHGSIHIYQGSSLYPYLV